MQPKILLTRPAPDGPDMAPDLARDTGLPVIVSPLFRIEREPALPDMTGVEAVIFTSRNAVRAYVEMGGPDLPAICVGEATARAARDAGLNARALGGNADRLVAALIAEKPGQTMLHLRGEQSHGQVAQRLTDAGFQVGEAVIYRQLPQPLSDEATDALTGPDPLIVPLYSPAAARAFLSATSGHAPLYIAAISPNVSRQIDQTSGQKPDQNPVAHLEIADRPDAGAMHAALLRCLATLRRVEGPDRGA